MDTLIFTDNQSYLQAKAQYTNAISVIQTVVDAFNSMAIDNLETNELNRAFSEPNVLVFDRLTNNTPIVIGGLTIDKSKALNLMVPPTGYIAFVAAVEVAKPKLSGMKISALTLESFFQINVSDQVEISTSLDAQLLEQNKYYTRSTRAEDEKAFADAVVSAYNENNIAAYYAGSRLDIPAIIHRLLNPDNTINHKLLNRYTTSSTPHEIINM